MSELHMLMVTPEWAELIEDLREARAGIKRLEGKAKELAELIARRLDDSGADGVEKMVELRRVDRETVDTKALRERFPEIAQACMKPSRVTSVVLL